MNELQVAVLVAIPLIALLAFAVVDVARRRELSVTRRIVWVAALVFVPVVALAVYLVVRPPRAVQLSGGDADASRAEAIVIIAERRQRGELTDEEYRAEIDRVASID